MATCSARLVHIIAESYAVKGKRSPWQPVLLDWSTSLLRVMLSKVRGLQATCSTRLVHIIAECYAVKAKRSPWQPVVLDWFTLGLRVVLSKVTGFHSNLFS